jgi:DNA-directed RNA polymerase subunit RPC12/RpoP
MQSQREILGRCTECDERIPAGWLLISYETASGTDRYAECPDCGQIVHPR